MYQFPLKPEKLTGDLLDLNRKMIAGIKALSRYQETDIKVGQTPREAIYRDGMLTLWHFPPLVEDVYNVPLVVVYSLVNRPFLADLQPGHSLIENLLKQGIDVYLVDFGYPTRNDRWVSLDDYVNDYIDTSVDIVRERHGLDQINLMGICQGGTFALCHAALHQEKLKNLVVMVAPVDFHTQESLLNLWAGSCPGVEEEVDYGLMVEAMGNVSGDLMNWGFLMQSPFQLTMQKYIDLLDLMEDEKRVINFLHMEKWIFDSPDQAGEAYREFLTEFYQQNKLVKGEFELGGQRIDLGQITIPVLNAYAEKDHIVPPPSSLALADVIGTDDYTVKSFPVGHIGMYVSRKTQDTLAPTIAEWLKERD